jgi:hypothetical protein
MQELAGWVAPVATMIAAIMTAANLGSRVTGWGFVVFSVGAVAWILVALGTGQQNLLYSNAFLLLVDLVGVWRWLGRHARYESGAEAAVAESRQAADPSLFALSKLPGSPVECPRGETIASTVDALAACRDGRIAYFVVSRGGVGGVGEKLHALGWHEVTIRDGVIETRLDEAALDRRPVLDPAHWPASAEAAGAA